MSLEDYKCLLTADVRPMDQDDCKIMFAVMGCPEDKVPLMEEELMENFGYQVALKRADIMKELFDEEVNRKLLIFVVSISDNPAKIVMWLFTLHLMFLLLKRNPTLDDFCGSYFPTGIPTEKAYKRAWDRQKRDRKSGTLESDNKLDDFNLWPKE